MTPDTERSAGASSAEPVTVRVQRTLRGRWEVVLPGRRRRITCETLDEARRVASLTVAHARPCELIVHDAYHRVLHHELIDGHQTPPTGSPPTAEQPKPISDVLVGNDASRAREDTPAPLAGSRRRAGPRSRRRPSAAPKQPTHQGGR